MKNIKKDFPIFKRYPKLVYLDSAATTQKPRNVIDTLYKFYSKEYATVHRGLYCLSMHATELYDEAREVVKEFIEAKDVSEIIFTRGATDSINLVARSLSIDTIKEGDEIIVSEMEHHSNLVPWQMVAKERKAVLKIIPITDDAQLDLETFKKILSDKTKIVAIAHIANATGTVHPIKKIIELSHEKNALVLIDGAQGISHRKVDVQFLDADFYVFSSHKIYGPTGIGVLYGKKEILEKMTPCQGGGDMIKDVQLYTSVYEDPPLKFEAGTPSFAQAIGLKAALEYIEDIGMENIFSYEEKLLKMAGERLKTIDGLRIIGNAENRAALISFIVDGVHPLDISAFLDVKDVAIRVGHHCAQPTMRRFGVEGTARMSLGIYNTLKDVERFGDALEEVIGKLRKIS